MKRLLELHIQKKILTRNDPYLRGANTNLRDMLRGKETVQHLGDNIAEGPYTFLKRNKSAARGRQL